MNSLQEERIEILKRADYLNAIHPTPSWKPCKNPCEICEELKSLGARYELLTISKRTKNKVVDPEPEILSQDEIENRKMKIICKGMDATKSDIRFLIEVAKVNKREAARLIGMNRNHFFEACRNWGIGEVRSRRTGT